MCFGRLNGITHKRFSIAPSLFLVLQAFFIISLSMIPTVFGGVSWKYKTDGTVNSVGVSADGSYIVAGTWSDSIFLFAGDGSLLWTHHFADDVDSVAISGDGSRIVVGMDEWSGRSDVYLFDNLGNIIWQKELVKDGKPREIAISPDAKYIVVGNTYNAVHFYDIQGNLIWTYPVGSLVDDVSTSTEGNYTAAGSWDNKLYFLDKAGNLLWSYDFGHFVSAVSVSPEGGYVAAGNWIEDDVYLFDKNGSLLLKTPFYISIDGVSLSNNADKIAVASYEKVSVIDKAANIIYERETDQTIEDIAITADGKFVAYGCGNYVYFFEPLPPSEITCKVLPTMIFLGGSVAVDGSINPPIGGAQVKLEYKLVMRDSTRSEGFINVTKIVTTSSDGSFMDAFTPNATGRWKIIASWSGGAEYMASETEVVFNVNPPSEISLASFTPVTLYWRREQWYCLECFPSTPPTYTRHYFINLETPTSNESKEIGFYPGAYWWLGHPEWGYWGAHTGPLLENTLIEKGFWNMSIWASADEPEQHFIVDLCYWDQNDYENFIASWDTGYINSPSPDTPIQLIHSFNLSSMIIPKESCLGFIICVGPDSNINLFFDSTANLGYLRIPPSTEVIDKIPPTIGKPTQEPKANIQPNQEVWITVLVTDSVSGVHNVTLWYSINNGTTWRRLNMIKAYGNNYQTRIPGCMNCTWVTYKITAYDNSGNSAVDTNEGRYYIYHVIPEFPTIISMFLLLFFVTIILFSKNYMRKLCRYVGAGSGI